MENIEQNSRTPRPERKSLPQRIREAAGDLRAAWVDFAAIITGFLCLLTATIAVFSLIRSPEKLGEWLRAISQSAPKEETVDTGSKGGSTISLPPPRPRYTPTSSAPKPNITPRNSTVVLIRDTVTVALPPSYQRSLETQAITQPTAAPIVINIIINVHQCAFHLEKQEEGTLTYVYVPDSSAVETAKDEAAEKTYDATMVTSSKVHAKRIYLKIQAVHTIGPGDIYSVVANKYGVSKEVLMKVNNKTSITARRGDRLIIPLKNENNLHLEWK